MPLQNRVTPFGDIVAAPQRGLFTGNRGMIHDPQTRTLLKRRWTSRAWIACVCAYKGRRRAVMAERGWTELFFLDEAVALAAGHRPCFFCRNREAKAFQAAFGSGNGVSSPRAAEMDRILHAERLDGERKRLHPLAGPWRDLPEGSVVAAGGDAFTVCGGAAFRWTADGYAAPVAELAAECLVTPPSTVRALAAGYRPLLHPALYPGRADKPSGQSSVG